MTRLECKVDGQTLDGQTLENWNMTRLECKASIMFTNSDTDTTLEYDQIGM